MAKLTDKSAIVTLSLSDLIHVVDVDDTTSDPLGTSKKAFAHFLKVIEKETVFIAVRVL